jgi:hypothetical protein
MSANDMHSVLVSLHCWLYGQLSEPHIAGHFQEQVSQAQLMFRLTSIWRPPCEIAIVFSAFGEVC